MNRSPPGYKMNRSPPGYKMNSSPPGYMPIYNYGPGYIPRQVPFVFGCHPCCPNSGGRSLYYGIVPHCCRFSDKIDPTRPCDLNHQLQLSIMTMSNNRLW